MQVSCSVRFFPSRRKLIILEDVIDIAWSRDDSLLASVGLDNIVWIWDGRNFGKLFVALISNADKLIFQSVCVSWISIKDTSKESVGILSVISSPLK